LEGGINLFVYVDNNPVNWIDPWGLDPIDPITGKDNPVLRCHAVTHNDPCENAIGAIIVGAPLVCLLAPEIFGTAVAGTTLWPAAGSGRQIINGVEYTVEALMRMAPSGLIQRGNEIVSRGVPPSAVENAIKFGTRTPGNTAGTVVRTFENVIVVTNQAGNRVITVIKTGH
jgi:hypothetical protein